MTFRFTERRNSRGTKANPPSEEREWIATGTADSQYVKAFAYSGTPPLIANVEGILYRQDISVDPGGFQTWIVKVPYAKKQTDTGSMSFTFSTSGGTVHITASKQTVNKYGSGAPDFKQLIGVNDNDVAGTDIVIPALKWSISYKHPMGVVTIPFTKQLSQYTGKSNSDTFLGCAAGEALFLGASGSDGTQAPAEVTYEIAYEKNLHDQVIGAITGIRKDGWDYAWIRWKDAVDVGRPVKQPEFVYVERVYERIALATALGFGG